MAREVRAILCYQVALMAEECFMGCIDVLEGNFFPRHI